MTIMSVLNSSVTCHPSPWARRCPQHKFRERSPREMHFTQGSSATKGCVWTDDAAAMLPAPRARIFLVGRTSLLRMTMVEAARSPGQPGQADGSCGDCATTERTSQTSGTRPEATRDRLLAWTTCRLEVSDPVPDRRTLRRDGVLRSRCPERVDHAGGPVPRRRRIPAGRRSRGHSGHGA